MGNGIQYNFHLTYFGKKEVCTSVLMEASWCPRILMLCGYLVNQEAVSGIQNPGTDTEKLKPLWLIGRTPRYS
jgi:hypothetical protein